MIAEEIKTYKASITLFVTGETEDEAIQDFRQRLIDGAFETDYIEITEIPDR